MAVFTGAGVAIITPFTENNEVNYEELGRLIDFQIAEGTDAIIVCGTTGEASTLTHEEHLECIRYAVEKTAKRVPIIAGTGSTARIRQYTYRRRQRNMERCPAVVALLQ